MPHAISSANGILGPLPTNRVAKRVAPSLQLGGQRQQIQRQNSRHNGVNLIDQRQSTGFKASRQIGSNLIDQRQSVDFQAFQQNDSNLVDQRQSPEFQNSYLNGIELFDQHQSIEFQDFQQNGSNTVDHHQSTEFQVPHQIGSNVFDQRQSPKLQEYYPDGTNLIDQRRAPELQDSCLNGIELSNQRQHFESLAFQHKGSNLIDQCQFTEFERLQQNGSNLIDESQSINYQDCHQEGVELFDQPQSFECQDFQQNGLKFVDQHQSLQHQHAHQNEFELVDQAQPIEYDTLYKNGIKLVDQRQSIQYHHPLPQEINPELTSLCLEQMRGLRLSWFERQWDWTVAVRMLATLQARHARMWEKAAYLVQGEVCPSEGVNAAVGRVIQRGGAIISSPGSMSLRLPCKEAPADVTAMEDFPESDVEKWWADRVLHTSNMKTERWYALLTAAESLAPLLTIREWAACLDCHNGPTAVPDDCGACAACLMKMIYKHAWPERVMMVGGGDGEILSENVRKFAHMDDFMGRKKTGRVLMKEMVMENLGDEEFLNL